MTDRGSLSGWLLVLAIFAGVVLPMAYLGLGAHDVFGMEGIVADGARTMERSGEYLVPRLHGEIYSYKPPLVSWLALAGFYASGESEWGLRWPIATTGVAMALFVLLAVGWRFDPMTGLLAAVASISGVLVVQKLRLAEFDMPLAAGVGVAATLAILELTAERSRGWLWPWAYLALAFAFLAKGMPALMFFAPGLLAAAWWTGTWRRLLGPGHLTGTGLFAVLVGAWVVGAYRAEGWGAFAQSFAEAGEKGAGWDLEAVGGTLLKPLVTIGLFFPWTVPLLAVLDRRVRHRLDGASAPVVAAALAFVVCGLGAFMLVPADEERYLLPIAAPVGIAATLVARRALTRRWQTVCAGVAAFCGLALIAGVLAAPWIDDERLPPSSIVIFTGLGTAMVVLARWPRPRDGAWRGLRSTVLLLGIALGSWALHALVLEERRVEKRSLRSVAAAFEAHMGAADEVWTGPVDKEFKHSGVFYYLDRPVRTFTAERRPEPDDFIVLFSDERPAAELVEDPRWRPLESQRHRSQLFYLGRLAAGADSGGELSRREADVDDAASVDDAQAGSPSGGGHGGVR